MKIRLRIKDLDCIDCARALERLAGTIAGVEDAKVNFTLSILDLELAAGSNTKSVIRSLRRKGYDAAPLDASRPVGTRGLRDAVSGKRLLFTALSGILLLGALVAHFAGASPNVMRTILIAATAAALPLALVRGLYAVRSLQIDMNVLMSVAVIAAAVIGEWKEAAVVAFLFSFATILEALAMARTRRTIESLMELAPDRATVRRNGAQVEVDPSDISPGEVIIVRPGERIPLEGSILDGTTSVDESPITGEAMPVPKDVGAQVFAGTLNEEGMIEVRVTKPKGESTLARIIHLVEHVEESKAPLERFIDRFARVYTPVVVAAAILMAVIPYLLNLEGNWINRSLVVLIIACPCALVIAIPVAIVSGLASAARKGILIKGGVHLEQAAGIKAIALDKTGTITLGRPSVSRVRTVADVSEEDLLRMAASVESASTHPLAGAILSEARSRGIHWPEPSDVASVTGTGMSATVDGRRCFVAKPEFFKGKGETETVESAPADTALREATGEAGQGGGTCVAVGTKAGTAADLLGIIEFDDDLRPGAAETVAGLKRVGIERSVMITGDRAEVAGKVASEAGLDAYHANLLPEDKVRIIRQVRESFGNVAVVGDGVNDAPALAASDLGIAMAAAGSDTAIDTADVALMSDDITKLTPLFRLARAVRVITYENISLAVGIKAVFLVFAFMGKATMWMAVFADMGASLIVIANALRLLSDRMTGLDEA
jgi:Cd2+/Zn2+-exporting ATPase